MDIGGGGHPLSCHYHAPCCLDTTYSNGVEWRCGGSDRPFATTGIGGGGDGLVVAHTAVEVGDCRRCRVCGCTLAVVARVPQLLLQRERK